MTTISRENYLKQLFVLELEHKQAVPMGALAAAMGVRPASVTGMVKAMVEAGLVSYEPYVGVSLSAAGRKIALDVIRRHRLIESFLVQTLGLDWSEVHAEAEALEHAISEKLLDRIDRYLGRPKVDPHGDPIPAANGKVRHARLKQLADCPPGGRVRVVRVSDQDAAFLQFVDRIGLRPGAVVAIEDNDAQAQVLRVHAEGQSPVVLATSAARKLRVEPA